MEKPIHKISKQGIEAAQAHAQAVERHGRDIEAIGARLKTRLNPPHLTPLPSFSERKNCIKALKSLYSRRIRGHASSQLSKAIRDTA